MGLDLYPCARCAAMEDDAARLRGMRLGRHERWIVWIARPPHPLLPYAELGEPFALPTQRDDLGLPMRDAEALRVALEDALSRVRQKGLVHAERRRGRRYIWRTPLGHAVVERYAAEFGAAVNATPGERLPKIRWDQRLDDAAAACRLPPERLQAILGAKWKLLGEQLVHAVGERPPTNETALQAIVDDLVSRLGLAE